MRKAIWLRHNYPDEIILDSQKVTFATLDIQIQRGNYQFVVDQFERLKTLKDRTAARFIFSDSKFFIEINGVVLNPTTAEEIFIVQEVYLRGVYNFSFREKVSVIDIGMNVGFASLNFASRSDVVEVYSFEPFEGTYRQALKNLEANPQHAKKIRPHNFGLGAKDEQLTVNYDYTNKGQVGIYGTDLIKTSVVNSDKVVIELKDASKVFSQIGIQADSVPLVVKMDCEGSEYAILKHLAETGVLNKVYVLMIEWHERGAEELISSLSIHGFSAFYQNEPNKRVGMIYAFK